MRTLKLIFFQLTFALACSISAVAQTIALSTPQLEQSPVLSKDGIEVRVIDEAGVQTLLTQSQKPLRLFTIITKGCGGTPDVLAYEVKISEEYGNQVDHWILVSDKVKDAPAVVSTLRKNGYKGLVYIIDDKYGNDPSDSRQKGTDFRNILCEECRDEIIGVPYKLLYNQNNSVIMHGYLSARVSPQNADLPSDFIGHFVRQLITKTDN